MSACIFSMGASVGIEPLILEVLGSVNAILNSLSYRAASLLSHLVLNTAAVHYKILKILVHFLFDIKMAMYKICLHYQKNPSNLRLLGGNAITWSTRS